MLLKPTDGMLVFVQMPVGGSIPRTRLLAFGFALSDRIAKVKLTIQRRTGKHFGRQRLFIFRDDLAENDRSLNALGVRKGSTLWLEAGSSPTVETLSAGEYQIHVQTYVSIPRSFLHGCQLT